MTEEERNLLIETLETIQKTVELQVDAIKILSARVKVLEDEGND
jgi:hypothetical protein